MQTNPSFDGLKSPIKEDLSIPMGALVHSKRDFLKISFQL